MEENLLKDGPKKERRRESFRRLALSRSVLKVSFSLLHSDFFVLCSSAQRIIYRDNSLKMIEQWGNSLAQRFFIMEEATTSKHNFGICIIFRWLFWRDFVKLLHREQSWLIINDFLCRLGCRRPLGQLFVTIFLFEESWRHWRDLKALRRLPALVLNLSGIYPSSSEKKKLGFSAEGFRRLGLSHVALWHALLITV